LKTSPDLAPDDEVRPEVVQAVHPEHVALHQGQDLVVLEERLDLRVLERVVDDVDTGGARARKGEAGEGIREVRSEGRELAGLGIDEERVPRPDLDRQGPAVEAALQGDDLERHPVVVDAVAPVDARASLFCRPVESDAGGPVVAVALAVALQERLRERIDLVVSADVLDVGVQLIAEADVQGELRVDAPVVRGTAR
jgi:hypothetical protein